MSRILFLTQVLPYPLDAGPKVRGYYMLRHLVNNHEVTLVSFVRPDDKPEYVDHLRSIVHAVHTLPMRRSLALNLSAAAKGLLSGLPMFVERDEMPEMAALLRRLAGETPLDLIHADQLSMASYGLVAAQASPYRPATLLDEHNAIYQAMHGHRRSDVKRIVLTASGGPFVHASRDELRSATPAQALKHPTWKMGAKITIDSSTLMNKGLEVIEAHWLFDLPAEQIDVVIHPQSIVHSMVEYVDGSVLAQLGIPDMAIPISYILAHPERVALPHLPSLDLVQAGRLEFFAPDVERFPCLGLAYEALRAGQGAPAVLNAANEVLVDAFLSGRIAYLDIPGIARRVLDRHRPVRDGGLEALLEADVWARGTAAELIGGVRAAAG